MTGFFTPIKKKTVKRYLQGDGGWPLSAARAAPLDGRLRICEESAPITRQHCRGIIGSLRVDDVAGIRGIYRQSRLREQ